MEGKYCVYKHTSPNGKVYIGITSQKPSARFSNGHGYKDCRFFNAAIEKYGWNNILHEIIEEGLTAEEASEKEKHYIKLYKSNDDKYGYNLTNGGFSAYVVSDSTKELKSKNSKRMWQSEEYRKNFHLRMSGSNNPMYGKHLSKEVRQKMSEAKKGVKRSPLSEETKAKLSAIRKAQGNFRTGIKLSEETKRKISESNKGKIVVISDETKKKISEALTGIKRSQETRAKMSVAAKENSKKRRKKVVQISADGQREIEVFESVIDAANKVKASSSTLICQCCKGKFKTAYGYTWRYVS